MKDFIQQVTELLKQARPRLSMTHQLEFKNCFGAIAGYVDGHIFISCGKFGVALRLPPETLASLFDVKEVKQLKYFPSGHIKKEYAVLPQQIIENKQRFKELLDESIKYASISQSSHR